MDATELSEQIKASLIEGDYAAAHKLVLAGWKEASEFGTFHSDVPEYGETWVKFKPSGYPFALRTQWDAARSDVVVMGIVLRYVESWNLVGTDGQPIVLPAEGEPRPIELIDTLDESLIGWLIRSFVQFWRNDLTVARKN